jgi:hypothetical protein
VTALAIAEPVETPERCAHCGEPVPRRKPSQRLRFPKAFCSRQHQKIAAITVRIGAANGSWKGGIKLRINHRGVPYRYVRCPDWARPMSRGDGYVAEHRLVMALRCGRLLDRHEVVHHLNHDPLDNAPENLELCPDQSTHKRIEFGRFPEYSFNLLYDPTIHVKADPTPVPF